MPLIVHVLTFGMTMTQSTPKESHQTLVPFYFLFKYYIL